MGFNSAFKGLRFDSR